MSRRRLFITAALIGVAVSLLADGSKAAFTDYRPEADEWFGYALEAAAPFLVLASMDVQRLGPWFIGLVLTVAVWAAYLLEGIPQLAVRGYIYPSLTVYLVATSWVWITLTVLLAGRVLRAPS
jgi:hypothetical protein